ncbi:MAG: FtsX-like permease family protein [Nitrososphaerota archaeon]|nr:FtsX-like permease family protein [Nitrososphaerota archaeon]
MVILLYKNTLLKIRKSLGRYISLLIIVMVGVGFYAGLQMTSPNIVNVADSYYKDYKLMDFKIVSSMGLTDDDVYALKQLEGVIDVVPSYSLDVQSGGRAIRIHAFEDNVNTVRLTDGRVPLLDTECVADSRHYSIGDKIEISGDVDDKIKNTVFTVVGLVESVLYLHEDYGSTNIGNGNLSSFIFINKDNFILSVYTEIYVVIETYNAVAYSDEYKTNVAKLNDKLVKIKPDRENARFDEIYNEARVIIEENEAKLSNEITKAEKEFSDAKRELDNGLQKLNNGKTAGMKEFEEAKAVLDENAQKLQDAKNKLAENEALLDPIVIENAKKEIADNERAINKGFEDYYANFALFSVEIAENEKKINDGYLECSKNLQKFDAEIVDAVNEINDAKTELSNIKHSQWYIYNRNAAAGYDELGNSIQVVAVVATIFPLFFILISMLMTSNSMTRMITEERNELGTLTSLGYKDSKITLTYLLYVLSASGLGAVIGFFVGCRVFPPLIYANFTFILPPLVLGYNLITFGLILITTFTLMIFVTIITCNRELKQKPASLMRPLPPKHGQQIFLEKITVIWKRLSFTWKITIRNMFRYKKRAFMTIVGIAGCASLLLLAFGIHDGMNGMAQKQYGDILRYDNMIILKDETLTISGELKTLLDDQQIIDPLLIRQSAYKCENDKKSLDAFLIVPENNELFEQYFKLKSTVDKKDVVLNEGNVIITQRIAVVYNLQRGDTLTIKDTDNNVYNLFIADIVENYASNYIYINAPTYEEIFGTPIIFNAIVSNHNTDKTNLAENLIDSGFAVNVIFTNDTIEKVLDNTESLNGVIILIVIVASILAGVVLYNLTAINISERIREIATLKVLGFRDSETNAYIYREAIILTIISIGIGMVLGVTLFHMVVDIIEVNVLSLYKNIEWSSYAMAGIITMIFSIFMQIITYFKLKKIDMIESLKSVE